MTHLASKTQSSSLETPVFELMSYPLVKTFENSLMDQRLPQTFPFVKWAGGKTQLLDRLDKLIPKAFDHYFEPFLGGGALFYHLARDRQFIAYLSDINQELIDVYEVVKSNVEELIDVLSVYKKEYSKAPENFYLKLRDEFDTGNRSRIEKAAKLITLNKTWTLSSKFPR